MESPIDRHLLASTVLLDGTLAFTTLLGIALDPVRGFTIVLAFLQPHLGDRTDNRSVIRIDRASETELVCI